MIKKCFLCKQEKHLSEFWNCNKSKDKKYHYCIICGNKSNKQQKIKALFKINEDLTCQKCGCDDLRILEINHKLANPRKEDRITGFLKRIINGERETDDLEILCKVCNIAHYVDIKFGKQPYKIKWNK